MSLANSRRPRGQDGPASGAKRPAPKVGPEIQDRIGSKLRAVYAEVLAEPVPEHLLALLDKLSKPDGSPE